MIGQPQQGAVGLGTAWSYEFPEEQLSGLHSAVGEAWWCLSSTTRAFPSPELGVGVEPLSAVASGDWMILFPMDPAVVWLQFANLISAFGLFPWTHHHAGHAWNILNSIFFVF